MRASGDASTDTRRRQAEARAVTADATDPGPESSFDSRWIEQAVRQRPPEPGRLTGWRLLTPMLLALCASLAFFLLLSALAAERSIGGQWQLTPAGGVALVHSADPALQSQLGHELRGIAWGDGRQIAVDADLLYRPPRGIVADAARNHMIMVQDQLGQAVGQAALTLSFADGASVVVAPSPRGLAGLGLRFWLFAALSAALFIGAIVLAARPGLASLLYVALALSQGTSVMMIAVGTLPGLGLPPGFARVDLASRVAGDMVAAAALLQLCLITPQRLPGLRWQALLAWAPALAWAAWCAWGAAAQLWSLTQAMLVGYGVAAIVALSWSQHRHPHPVTIVLRRLAAVATATMLLLTWSIAVASHERVDLQVTALAGPLIWYVFFAALLLLLRFLSRPQKLVREFALLAGVCSVAASLDLIFPAVLPIGSFAAKALTLFVALGVYAGARQWLLGPQLRAGALSAEHLFESLYRVAREVERAPHKATEQLTRLLTEFFEPMAIVRAVHPVSRTRVTGDGATLVVPLPRLPAAGDSGEPEGVLMLRFAQRGRRLFTIDDARLTDRVIEQLRRAVAFDRAVEHGRSEERTRIAQDLHDDIGARLLTMMYKAQDPEMEEYVRHTLQDLKTLTRGLAAADHRLSHAAAEWKADIGQRLALAHCDLDWSFSADRDITLSVVQWSALTRILRELVNNIIAHAHATQVEIAGQYERGRLMLTVVDDGIGRQPEAWSHGLGLGGVRKRVKLLAGEVSWRERGVKGIRCEVRLRLPGARA